MNYYNEIDPGASAWLRELIGAKLIPDGHVDTRSICDVQPGDLAGYAQCHFFAGIGGWAHALKLADWPTDVPVWTGSCPCQPFSISGRQRGESDERHLWPEMLRLISECRPTVAFGEQVASPLGREWLSGVRSDVEALGYAVGAADLCAAGVGAPHIRQRLFWVANSNHSGSQGRGRAQLPECSCKRIAGPSGDSGGVEVPGSQQQRRRILGPGEGHRSIDERTSDQFGGSGNSGGLEHPTGNGRLERGTESSGGSTLSGCCASGFGDSVCRGQQIEQERDGGPDGFELRASSWADAHRSGFWSGYDIVYCRDGKARRIEPGTFPLAHGVSGRVGLLRGYGNAIVAQVAAEFIRAFADTQ